MWTRGRPTKGAPDERNVKQGEEEKEEHETPHILRLEAAPASRDRTLDSCSTYCCTVLLFGILKAICTVRLLVRSG